MIANVSDFDEVFSSMSDVFNTNLADFITDRKVETDRSINKDAEAVSVNIIGNEDVGLFQSTLNNMDSSFSLVPDLLRDIYAIIRDQLSFEKETERDNKRKEDFDSVKEKDDSFGLGRNPAVFKDDSAGFFDNLFGGISFARIIAGFAIAPFVYNFAKGFVGSITDELVELTAPGMFGVAAALQKSTALYSGINTAVLALTGQIQNSKIGTYIFSIVDNIGKVKTGLSSIGSPIIRLVSVLGNVAKSVSGMFSMIPGSGVIKTLLGRLAWPITLVLGFVEAWNSFAETEGTFIEKFGAAVGGFFASILGAPLDLLKGIATYIMDKFGFENARDALQEFSFSEKIREIVSGAFDTVSSIVDWVKSLFVNPTEALSVLWQNAMGGYKSIMDIIWMPIDKAVQWISGAFGWQAGEDFSLSDTVWNGVESSINWIKGIFSNPLESIQEKWSSAMNGALSLGEWVANVLEGVLGSIKNAFSFSTEGTVWEDFSLQEMFMDTLRNLRDFFSDLFDFLPSIDDIKSAITSSLPKWMQPEAAEEQRSRIMNEIQEQEKLLNEGDTRNWRGKSREEIVQELRNELSSIPSYEADRTNTISSMAPSSSSALIPSVDSRGSVDDILSIGNPVYRAKQDYMAVSAQRGAIEERNAQSAFMNIMPQMINANPITNNSTSTTIINNVSPSRSLDDPSMLR